VSVKEKSSVLSLPWLLSSVVVITLAAVNEGAAHELSSAAAAVAVKDRSQL
jgi:hypothetical protein